MYISVPWHKKSWQVSHLCLWPVGKKWREWWWWAFHGMMVASHCPSGWGTKLHENCTSQWQHADMILSTAPTREWHRNIQEPSQSKHRFLLKSHQVIPSDTKCVFKTFEKVDINRAQRTVAKSQSSDKVLSGRLRTHTWTYLCLRCCWMRKGFESALGPPGLNTLILPPCGHRPFSVTAPREREKMHDPWHSNTRRK